MGRAVKQGKTALVTGASSGIGLELADLLARDGYDLVLVARTKSKLDQMADEFAAKYGISTVVIAKELSLSESAGEIIKELNNHSIKIDVLINNAGFNEYGRFAEMDLQASYDMIQVNITSLTALTSMLLPAMIARKQGKVMNVGSTGSFSPCPNSAVYAATKAYVLSFSAALAEELKGTGVTVTTLCPGPTESGFASRAGMEHVGLFKFGVMDSRRVAEIGYRAMMKGQRAIVAGLQNKITVFSLRFISLRMASRVASILNS
ncbi:MAG: SDR family NAD(P)-dependent oxidoreductase [Acidobacteriota bacterium]